MENAKISNMVSYENWVKMLNRNTKVSDTVKLQPKSPSSRKKTSGFKEFKVKRDEKIPVSEMWIG